MKAPVATRTVHTLPAFVGEHLAWLHATRYARSTIASRRTALRHFVRWATERGVTSPRQLTLSVLERYQQTLALARDASGRAHAWGTQAEQLIALKGFCRWCTRTHLLRANPAQELVLPRRPLHLPRTVLSHVEVEQVLAQCDVADPLGLRDRALLEVLYSTGLRRTEAIHLTLPDVDPGRGVVFVREGKGARDRVVPIGARALRWVDRYLLDARPLLIVPPDPGVLFLTRRGKALAPNRLSELVHQYLAASKLGKTGSCHVFRHTMATLLLEHGADVRHIQAMLGHAHLATTARYTHVAIHTLKLVHQRTHPAEQEHEPMSDARSAHAPSSLAADLPPPEPPNEPMERSGLRPAAHGAAVGRYPFPRARVGAVISKRIYCPMTVKPLHWLGTSQATVRHFPPDARRDTGYQLWRVQEGDAPSDWKPMPTVGSGVRELRVHVGGGYRVLYLATRPEAVYVLHAFAKRTQRTRKLDLDLARARLRELARQARRRDA